MAGLLKTVMNLRVPYKVGSLSSKTDTWSSLDTSYRLLSSGI
jgi:hypothetical protein